MYTIDQAWSMATWPEDAVVVEAYHHWLPFGVVVNNTITLCGTAVCVE
jgi:hypothetical protein